MRKELEEVLIKKADAVSDMIGAGQGIPGLIGRAVGMFDEPAEEDERADMDRSALRGVLIPGVGGYRNERRMKGILKNDKGETPHYWSQNFGGLTSTGALALLGSLVGTGASYAQNRRAGYTPKQSIGYGLEYGAPAGAATGAGLGLLASLAGGIGAAFTKRRTKEEQQAYNNTSTWKNWLIPGNADYNHWKAVGRNVGDSEARVNKEEKKEDTGEKKTAAAAFGAIPAIGNALSPAPAPATVAKPQQAATAQNQQQQAQNQAGEQAPQADTNTIADLTASLNKITDVAKNSIKTPAQNTVAQNGGGETAQAEAVSGALKAASARYTKIASDRKRAIIYGIINKVMK